jgi:hypothetical protein
MENALIKSTPSAVDFGSQALGTSSAARRVDISAFGNSDVKVLSLYTASGDDADFWIANDGCHGTVAPDPACTVQVRFNPSGSGNRATALYARVEDPQDASKIRTLQIAALSGTGGQLPQGPAGPKGDAGPQGAPGTAYTPPHPPSIRRGKYSLRLSSKSTATVATIKCLKGSCKVSSRSARLKIGTRTYKVTVTGSRTIAAGKSATVGVSVGKRVRDALRRRGTVTLTVNLGARSSDGASVSRTITARLRAR